MAKKIKPISKEEMIQLLEKKLRNPDINEKSMAVLTRKLNILRGWEKPYARTLAERQAPPEPPTDELPPWWSDSWCRIFIAERACGSGNGAGRWTRELDQFEIVWAQSEGLTVDQLREQLQREHAEWLARPLEERLAELRRELYERYPDQYLAGYKTAAEFDAVTLGRENEELKNSTGANHVA